MSLDFFKNSIRFIFNPFVLTFLVFLIILITGQYSKVKGFFEGVLFTGSFGFGIYPVITGIILVMIVCATSYGISWGVNKLLS